METIDDIVYEVRGNAEHNHALVEVSKYLTEIADRIEKAYRLMVEGLNGGIVERDQYIYKLTEENARLRAELNEKGRKEGEK